MREESMDGSVAVVSLIMGQKEDAGDAQFYPCRDPPVPEGDRSAK